jgi:hypothetical protein
MPVDLVKCALHVQCPGKAAHPESPVDHPAVLRQPACAAKRGQFCEPATRFALHFDLISAVGVLAGYDG